MDSPVALAQALIRYPSVTPRVEDALDYLENLLSSLGFVCRRLAFGEGEDRVVNLYAQLGTQRPNFCFAGHMDVVPTGSEKEWSVDPFAGVLQDDHLLGRGAVDMKGAIAAFLHAVAKHQVPTRGSISMLITGDEEGPAINGTVKMLDWMQKQDYVIDDCLVGEPTCRERLGDTIKIGRRGSLNLCLSVRGTAGHVAYPEFARNPMPVMARMIADLSALELDEGNDSFQPSRLTCTSIDTNNSAANVIPGESWAHLNIRFNDLQTRNSLEKRLRSVLDPIAQMSGCTYVLDGTESGQPFLGQAKKLIAITKDAIFRHTGVRAELSTGGGTSDARFIRKYAPVVDFGLVGHTMHQADERVAIRDLEQLAQIYGTILKAYFSSAVEQD